MYPKVPYFIGIGLAILCLAFELMSTGCDFSGDAMMGKPNPSDGPSSNRCSQLGTTAHATITVSSDCPYSYSTVNVASLTPNDDGSVTVQVNETNGQFASVTELVFVYQMSRGQFGQNAPGLALTCGNATNAPGNVAVFTCVPPAGVQVHDVPTTYSDRVYGFDYAQGGFNSTCGGGSIEIERDSAYVTCTDGSADEYGNNFVHEWPLVSLTTTNGSAPLPYLWVSEPTGGWPSEGQEWPTPAASSQPAPSPSPSSPR